MRAIYAFSGDPITDGHIDIVRRASRTYQEVVVAIGENPQKTGKYLFSSSERLALTRQALAGLPNVSCVAFSGLLGEYAYRHGFDVIIRGVRNNSDLENELVLFAVTESLHASVDTVFFPTRRHLSHISSGTVKAIVAEGGDVSAYCPLAVKEALEQRLLGRFTIGVAGGIAAGKSVIARQLVATLGQQVSASYISLDEVGHYVLGPAEQVIYRSTREAIAKYFGPQVWRPDSSIDRRALGRIVFADPQALAELDRLMREPMLARLYEETRSLQSHLVVIEGAILVEAKWTNLVNNNLILVDAPEALRVQRLLERGGGDPADALAKIRRQISAEDRLAAMQQRIAEQGWGRLWQIQNDGQAAVLEAQLAPLRAELLRLVART